MPDMEWFVNARYGLFIHYGLYSLLGRGEWVMDRESIDVKEYARLASQFTAENFNADELIGRAKKWGMKYAVLTTKHHEGFCLYDSKLTDFTAPKTAARRDLVAEFVAACRKHGLRIGLYHTLNDWSHSPNSVDALDRPTTCYQPFIDYVHGQIREIMSNYGKIDIMWYDGWWPFTGDAWQGRKLTAMVRDLQPGIIVNNRTGYAGDYATPEGHLASSTQPWEACMTLNNNWGFHRGDTDWKSPKQVAEMLRQCAAGRGNLLLNVGPRGDGSVPQDSLRILDRVGDWLAANGEAVYNTDRFEYPMHSCASGRGDWDHSGNFSAAGNAFYWHVRHWPDKTLRLAGVQNKVLEVSELATDAKYAFTQEGEKVFVQTGVESRDTSMPIVIRFRTEGEPRIYRCGAPRRPAGPHVRYDPYPSEG